MGLPYESTKDLPFSIFTTSGYNGSCKKRKSTIRFSGSTDFSSKPAKLPKKCVLPQESFKFTVLRTLAFLFGFVGRPFYSTIMLIYANFSANIFLFILGPGLVLNMIPIVISLNSESKFGMVFAMVIEVSVLNRWVRNGPKRKGFSTLSETWRGMG
uniref:Vesicle transport protein n=1 Tax=Bursaphelenchus xylophilus TaxID=6326 RepID=A0A1I7RK01_BURXY